MHVLSSLLNGPPVRGRADGNPLPQGPANRPSAVLPFIFIATIHRLVIDIIRQEAVKSSRWRSSILFDVNPICVYRFFSPGNCFVVVGVLLCRHGESTLII